MTYEEYVSMIEAQGGGCAICLGNRTPRRALQVDHNHKSGEVRGILCSKCNLLVAALEGADRSVVENAKRYFSVGQR